MAERILSVPLTRMEDPIAEALAHYHQISGYLNFDAAKACKLELTPDKPNSARSATDVRFMTEKIGTLYVIAFKPGDGTGDESGYKLADLRVARPYPRRTLIVPRNKVGVNHEAHLTIATFPIDDDDADARSFAGTFDLMGLNGNRVVKIGELGHFKSQGIPFPLATLTVGYGSDGKRFGDPHAVYSGITDAIQVCAFLAISDAVHATYRHALDSLSPFPPRKHVIL